MDQIEAIVREVVARLANEKKPCPDRLIPAEHLDETKPSECTMCAYDGRIAILLYKTGEARKLI